MMGILRVCIILHLKYQLLTLSILDTSKVLEPPETPAPVFAIRAFRSALFGTPTADEETPRAPPQKETGHQRSKSDTTKPISIEKKEDAKPDFDPINNPSGSPTKSILVTPGTISNRRKTVSFGESVVDNEGKRESRVNKTPPNPAGNLSAQWISGSAEGKPRSKLTQTLMDARENATKNAEAAHAHTDNSSDATPTKRSQSKNETTEDITLNLDEPRSESGKYWKTEFDAYRVRTNREIKKLIQYRSIAKSFARKKDVEAEKLADKLREEEEKVTEMERQVSRLASTIVGEGSKANQEHLIQDLTKQTALALQYKQQVTSLRKLLEQQGVVDGQTVKSSEQAKGESSSADTTNQLHKAQLQLKQANSEIEELSRQNPALSELRTLAQSSEKKAEDLEKENKTLKQTLARVKQEMSRYEGRRKEKETKFKQREAKLEARIQEYRDRLKKTTQERRASEDALRSSFDEERRRMQAQIDLLKQRAAGSERSTALQSHRRHSLSPRKDYTGIRVFDFAENDHPRLEEEVTEDIEAPASPSPRSKTRETRHFQNATTGAFDLKRHASRDITANDDEVTHYLNEILPKSQHISHRPVLEPIPPSSPPHTDSRSPLKDIQTKYHSIGNTQRTYRSLYPREPDNIEPGQTSTRPHRPRNHIKSTLDSISGLPSSRGTYGGHTVSAGERAGKRYGLADMKGVSLSPERVAAARSRLRQKRESRKVQELGKEVASVRR